MTVWYRKITTMAIMISLLTVTACSSSGSTSSGESADHSEELSDTAQSASVIHLKAITMGKEPASGMDEFYKQLDALTIKDFGATLRFDFIPWGEEKSIIGRAIVTKAYDFYVGGFWTDFKDYASKNAFVDLVPLLDQVPKLVEHYGNVLDRVKINGKLYGLPTFGKPAAGSYGVLYREDLRKQWGLPAIHDFSSLEQYLYKAKDEYSDTPMINDKRFGDVLWDILTGGKYYTVVQDYAVAAIAEPYKAINKYETPEYKQMVEIARKWYRDGVVDHDILASQNNETAKTVELMKANKKPLEFSNHFGAVSFGYIDVLNQLYPEQQFGWFDIKFDLYPQTVFMPKISVETSSMISIGSNSKYPETALKLLEKAHTDPRYYVLLQYGVEGEHYKLIDNAVSFEGIAEENRKPYWTGLADGYLDLPVKYPDQWQEIVNRLQYDEGPKLAMKNGIDPYEGFVFDTAPVSAQLERMESKKVQFIQPLAAGVSDDIDNDLSRARQELKEAGIDDYMRELQSQLDKFAAAR
ncbi:ABC transporter substrate-binding protein [Paenibacillus sp. CCS19]|uniref:DUF3502 domain-containing protein n=1 Tax=Paenibacillus sp. CCS19 TaxID=3158387 RepID=UPI00256807BA|nr:DUF3502 domain-containing protein [Paenibacillus cellulosilyticus]GMK39219.1 ABC transporter substrate-binding protein [Paenibacillus cellulosilyticus]